MNAVRWGEKATERSSGLWWGEGQRITTSAVLSGIWEGRDS
jgi:hypothetical protein